MEQKREQKNGHTLVYATRNPAKLAVMEQYLAGTGIVLQSLGEVEAGMGMAFPKVEEDGNSPLENAIKKARAYYEICRRPLFSCDSGLFIEGLPPAEQPGVCVRRVGGRELDDEEMQAHYLEIVKRLGGRCLAQYRNAICLVLDEKRVYTCEGDAISGEAFYLTMEVRPRQRAGFPLDAMSADRKTGRHFYDLEEETEEEMKRGIADFFRRCLSPEAEISFPDVECFGMEERE